jgi:uncharacterized membrane protein
VRAATLHRLLLIAILAGLAFSIYAAIEVTVDTGLRNTCSVNSVFSCGRVDSSAYTNLGPVPDWSVGVGGFVVLLALDIPLLLTYDPRMLNAVLGLSIVGLLVAAGLAAVEVFLIHAVCPICLGAYISDAAVLGFALGLLRLRRAGELEASEGSSEPSTTAG